MRLQLITIAFTLAAAQEGRAALVIDVGSHNLFANKANQTLSIFVSGGDAVEGLNLLAQIGQHTGLEVEPGPVITGADVIGATIFSANNLGQFDSGSLPQLASVLTLTAVGSVPAAGKLVTLTIDTTGFDSGTWPLLLADTVAGSTDFAGIAATITNGTISLVGIPEPACLRPLPLWQPVFYAAAVVGHSESLLDSVLKSALSILSFRSRPSS